MTYERTPPPVEYGAVLRQIGVTEAGGPIYTYRDTSPVMQAAPVPSARPWGSYIALATVGAIAVSAVAMAAAVLAIAVAISAMSLTITVVVFRSIWQDYRRSQSK